MSLYCIQMSLAKDLLKISAQVLSAFTHRKPVVALQSTIISHGMPYPNNKNCAIEVEAIVRKFGAVPATIALMHGKICIGLTEADIEELAQAGTLSRKVSRRDIPFVLAQKGLGSTTVAGTMICSALAGIDIFVTGGLGGVHRGYEQTMDVSADLRQLGRTPVTVVSAGVKNILDIPRTLEYLQTEGVPVITYGSKYFPAFFSPSSGIESPFTLNSIAEIANVLAVRKQLNLQNGVLVGVPAEDTGHGAIIQAAINRALKQAHDLGIKGAATTPFLLKKVHEYSGGVSIQANINLVKRNAQIGSQLAVHLASISKPTPSLFSLYSNPQPIEPKERNTNKDKSSKVIVIGGSAVDFQVQSDGKLHLYQACKGSWRTCYGGVGRNISQVCSRLGAKTTFITAIGGDKTSEDLKQHIESIGIQIRQIKDSSHNAPTYLGVLDDNKDVMISISDMEVNNKITFQAIYQRYFKQQQSNGINCEDIVVVDANILDKDQNLLRILKYLSEKNYFIIYECKGTKATRIITNEAYRYISLLKMNEKQRNIIVQTLQEKGVKLDKENQYQWFAKNIGCERKDNKYTGFNTIITNGDGLITMISSKGQIKQLKPIKSNKVVKTTGAGDTLTGTISALLLKGYSLQQAVKIGTIASKLTIQSQSKTSPIYSQLTYSSLSNEYEKYRSHFVL